MFDIKNIQLLTLSETLWLDRAGRPRHLHRGRKHRSWIAPLRDEWGLD